MQSCSIVAGRFVFAHFRQEERHSRGEDTGTARARWGEGKEPASSGEIYSGFATFPSNPRPQNRFQWLLFISAAAWDVRASPWSDWHYFGCKHEACDCSTVMGIRALDCSLAQMGAIHKERWESDFLFLLECCLVPASKYCLVA